MTLLLLTLLAYMPVTTIASWSQAEILTDWQDFHKNPKEYLGRQPRKSHVPANAAIIDYPQTTQHAERGPSVMHPMSLKSRITNAENPLALIDNEEPLVNIFEMNTEDLLAAKIPTHPWSDDYWPLYKGILGNRYMDDGHRIHSEWDASFNYIVNNTAWKIIASGGNTDLLSPAEKYDLLVGDNEYTLTRSMWSQGKMYFDRYGDVERWMGICHGWAIASYMEERPHNKITVMAADGKTKLNFYPSDIKGLTSLLWANAQRESKFIGGRCNDKEAEIDTETGRILKQECFDVNPGAWHISLINQIGISKRSFILDANYDYEVWNHPVISYEYVYFNPTTGMKEELLENAIIPRQQYTNDVFQKFRAQETAYYVGIALVVKYGIETAPTHRKQDGEQFDASRSVYYLYDLELDANKNIIGGEWYNNAHPDFLWTAPIGSQALSVGDFALMHESLWDGKNPIKQEWQQMAKFAARKSQPLNKIIKSLIALSNN
jgi:hypothetical protein